MSIIACSASIGRSAEELFTLTQDYSMRRAWDPFPESYEFHGGANGPEVGVELTVVAKNGQSMRVRYVSFAKPRTAAIEMLAGPWFIRRFAGTWRFEQESKRSTKVIFKYNVLAGPIALAPVLQPVLNHLFRKHAMRRLQALKSYAENPS
jgi:ribosome-associated toxin RatA of RatAB toxin-antitoxin module